MCADIENSPDGTTPKLDGLTPGVKALLKQVADAAEEAKSTFLANISHEIRTPLNAILGFAELLSDPVVPVTEKVRCAEIIRRNGLQLLEIVDEILDLSKLEAGKLKTDNVDVNLPNLLSAIQAALKAEADAKSIILCFRKDQYLPERVTTDPLRIKQILNNIVGNAIKFTDQGSVEVSVKFSSSSQGSFLHFEITDTGPGIDFDTAGKLFRPFSQADSSSTRTHGGSGLGLVLSRSLARAMGGDVRLNRSKCGAGSSFQVDIRVDLPAAEGWRQDTEFRAYTSEQPLKGRRILLVEDVEDNQFLITQFLGRAGATVEIAENGLEGIEKAMAADFDAVLMDIQMPKVDGYQATARLRQAGYKRPIVALTAHALLEERQKCLRIGCTDHLTKPINRQRLIDTLLNVIDA